MANLPVMSMVSFVVTRGIKNKWKICNNPTDYRFSSTVINSSAFYIADGTQNLLLFITEKCLPFLGFKFKRTIEYL